MLRSRLEPEQSDRKILPMGVPFLDQRELTGTIPFLQRLFPKDRRFHRFVLLEPDEVIDAVAGREALDQAGAMLMHASDQVRRDADIECPPPGGWPECRRSAASPQHNPCILETEEASNEKGADGRVAVRALVESLVG